MKVQSFIVLFVTIEMTSAELNNNKRKAVNQLRTKLF